MQKGHFVVDDSIGVSLFVAAKFNKDAGSYLLVTSNLYKAQKLYSLISSFVGSENVLLYPSDELIRAECLSQSKEMMANRLYTLYQINEGKAKIVIANLSSCTRYLPSPLVFKENSFFFKLHDEVNLVKLKRDLVRLGYSLVNKVDQSLQFAVRGDIIDIFSVNNSYPVRIELFGDEIESIRSFDIGRQTSLEKLSSILILPANEMLFSNNERDNLTDKIHSVLENDKKCLTLSSFEELRDNTDEDIFKLLNNQITSPLYKYYSLIIDKHFSLFDYCKDFTKVLIDVTSIEESNKIMLNESFDYLNELHSSLKVISHLEMYQDIHRLISFAGPNTISTSNFFLNNNDFSFDISNVPYRANKNADALNIIHSYLNDNYQIVLSLSNNEQINLIQEDLLSSSIPYEKVIDFNLPTTSKIGFTISSLPNGFCIPSLKVVYLTSFELFNEKNHLARFDNRFKEATILRSFEDLNPGDFVVHEYQGIGQFLELNTLLVDGVHKDFLKIAYSGDEILYVPLSQFQLVRKYMGKDGIAPRLSRLHSKDWENQKKRIKERINDLAERLMHLYIERSKIVGFSFSKDDEFQRDFENRFEFTLTKDQDSALNEIKKDMESSSPMDRLLCGDVGFGKTEVAFRAAFKAINSGKQVALLCPTTLLARQHYELALKRFLGFDIKIAVFSRLIPEAKQKEYIKGVNDGSIHLIIGTHRLLSKDIIYHDLGLLIVDEEQRFGVEQKEKIKELKSNLDVLTLSATPIPRTLQISLLGVRSLSRISTPPINRMPIQTYVTPYKAEVVKELIERELGRNGQVFYLHNNISTLYMCANRIQKAIPNAVIGVAHGKMERDEIEDIMMRFYKGDIQVLVCTSIIENGIDVPNANMIIVENAQNYGLSQLYQIKGRVGRSDRIAYAYLMYNENQVLNEKAQKRLEAIQDFTDLGSGYKIAQRDLMIRGAGDILGPEQAGFIDSIGLDMYIKLLNEAVQEKMNVKEEKKIELVPNLNIDAYIPDSYASTADKIEMYQEIISAPSLDALSYLKVKTRDVYGPLPKEVEALFSKRNIDLLVEQAKLDSFIDRPKEIEITMGKNYINIKGIGNLLFEALIPYLSFIKMSYIKNTFHLIVQKKQSWLNDIENILNVLSNIQNNSKQVN